MKKFLCGFVYRGFVACGFGPITLAVAYILLQKNGVVQTIPANEAAFGILASAILAFIAGGINAIYQVEQLPLLPAIFIHAITLYADYIVIYLVNNWIKAEFAPLAVFTVCFFTGFAVIWVVIYIYIKKSAEKMTRKLTKNQQKDS